MGTGLSGGLIDEGTEGSSHISQAFPEMDITVAYSVSTVRGPPVELGNVEYCA